MQILLSLNKIPIKSTFPYQGHNFLFHSHIKPAINNCCCDLL